LKPCSKLAYHLRNPSWSSIITKSLLAASCLLIGHSKMEESKHLPRSSYHSSRCLSHLSLVSSGPTHFSGVGALRMVSSHRFSFAFRSERYAIAYPPGRVGRISQHLLASFAGAASTENRSGPADDLYDRQDTESQVEFKQRGLPRGGCL
jgi:hypothetical protein